MQVDRRSLLAATSAGAALTLLPGLAAAGDLVAAAMPTTIEEKLTQVVRELFKAQIKRDLNMVDVNLEHTTETLAFHGAGARAYWSTVDFVKAAEFGIDLEAEIVAALIHELCTETMLSALKKAKSEASFRMSRPPPPLMLAGSNYLHDAVSGWLNYAKLFDTVGEPGLSKFVVSTLTLTNLQCADGLYTRNTDVRYQSHAPLKVVGWLGDRKHPVLVNHFAPDHEPIIALKSEWISASYNRLIQQKGDGEGSIYFRTDLDMKVDPSKIAVIQPNAHLWPYA